MKVGVLAPLLILSKSSSIAVHINTAEVLLSLSTIQKNRGTLIQQGAIPALLSLTNLPTLSSNQALAKLAITIDPKIGFPRTYPQLIPPLSKLLKSDFELQQFEGMMALTNLAVIEEARSMIVKCTFLLLIQMYLL